jgi:hypothetical protein
MTTPPHQSGSPQPPKVPGRFVFEPMPEGGSPGLVIETVLKYPGQIIHELQNNRRAALPILLLFLALLGMAAYGFVVGSFSGGAQMWIAPAKIAMGTLLSILICLPSLYIFACLAGIDARLRTLSGTLFAAIGISALLLIGLAPVAWIFSQSTESIAFMAVLHIGFWAIGITFGLRLVESMSCLLSTSARSRLRLWRLLFLAVCLQMMTTLRPIIGTSERFLPVEKKFFLIHWLETLTGDRLSKEN